jgi:hypothetical protein
MPSRSVASSRSTTTPTTGTSRVRKSTVVSTHTTLSSSPSPTHEAIALRAHELYVQSGFQGGRELEFWLEAERQLKGGMQLS